MARRDLEILYRSNRPIPCFWCSKQKQWVQQPCGHELCAQKDWR